MSETTHDHPAPMPLPEAMEAHIWELIRDDDWDAISGLFATLHPADISEIIDQANREDRERLFALVEDDLKPDVLAEVDPDAEAEIVQSLSNTELSDIVEEMPPDEATDVIGELSRDRSEQVLELMEKEDADEVRKLLAYEEDTAGGIMTTDVVAMRENQTIKEALDAIADFEEGEPFYYANIVDERGFLIGYVDVWELLRERDKRGRRLADMAHRDFASAHVDMDQEEVAQILTHYDMSALPVVDDDGRLVGRITADDVFDVMEEEASEDIFKLAGSDDIELEFASPLRSTWVRLPWLLITLLGGFMTSFIMRHYQSHVSVAGAITLMAFVPVILAMGGNTGIQSSTLMVRSIALGTNRGQKVLRLLVRELATGAIMGLFCGGIIGLWARLMITRGELASSAPSPVFLALVVAVALFSAMMFAALFGTLVPLILNRMKIDPAIAAGPFITIANDVSALLIYFGTSAVMFRLLIPG